MNPELQTLLIQLVQGINQVLNSGEHLSDEFQGMLAQTLEAIVARIDETSQETIPSLGGPPPELEPGPYPSSNVNSFKYNPKTGTLFVKFHGKESADSGPIYRYQNVPLNVYDVFSKGRVAPKTSGQNRYHRWIRGVTPSLGASLYALIREGGYAYQRVA